MAHPRVRVGGSSRETSGGKAGEMGLGAMKNLESSAKQPGLEDTMPSEQGRDRVIREAWRTSSCGCDVAGFIGGRGSESTGVLRGSREGGWGCIGSFGSCAVTVGRDAGSALCWRRVYADAVENKATRTRRPAESVSLSFSNFPQAIHLLGKLPSKESC